MSKLKLFVSLVFFAILLTGCGKSEITPSCVMNGYGQGSCSFTNTGDGSGSTCGFIEVSIPSFIRIAPEEHDKWSRSSTVFCSGDVKPSSTNEVGFHIMGVDDLCPNGLGNTSTMSGECVFIWQEK
jgi:hypothetical protein